MSDLELVSNSSVEERLVSIFDIEEHPENRAVNQEIVANIAASIQEDGLAQWPLVRIHPDDESKFQHIAGWHRILAYRKLYEETGDEQYTKINVVVKLDCDDETAERLVWATNMDSASLSPEEFGRGALVLGRYVDKLREENPEEFKGVRTAEAVAEMISKGGKKVSKSKVARSMKQAKDAEAAKEAKATEPEQTEEVVPEKKPDPKLKSAMNRLDKVLDELEAMIEAGGDDGIAASEALTKRSVRIKKMIQQK